MTKELLYIPTGSYYRFNNNTMSYSNFAHREHVGEHLSDKEKYTTIVRNVCQRMYKRPNYVCAGIQEEDKLDPSEFELVEIK